MNKDEILQLIDKYLEGIASEQEIQVLQKYYESFQHTSEWDESELGDTTALEEKMLQRLKDNIHSSRPSFIARFYRTSFMKVAAAVMLLLGIAVVWRIANNKKSQQAIAVNVNKAVQPQPGFNGCKAILTLTSGKSIFLDNVSNGMIANEENSTVYKQDGELIYEANNQQAAVATAYNTITTQRGGEYLIVLPDGTKVWLNAASSLRFPPAFTGKERHVEIKGEAYFEVAKNAAMPFKVAIVSGDGKSKGNVEVLGTHFNINGYDEEATVKTTLLEGSVKITPVKNAVVADTETRILAPGQQAQIGSNN